MSEVGLAPTFAFLGARFGGLVFAPVDRAPVMGFEAMRAGQDGFRAMLAPAIEALGFELVGTEVVRGGGQAVFRVYIDRPEGITVDDCAAVSRQVSAILDVEDPIPGQYVLEVSSPGLDRPLMRAQDFERFAGSLATVRTAQPVGGRRNFKGVLLGVNAGQVGIEVDGTRLELPLALIEKARLVPEL